MEPEILRKGKAFHQRVQAAWAGEIEGAAVRLEHGIKLGPISGVLRRLRRGRLDIFIDQVDDFVTVVEIKSTDWDYVVAENRQRLLAAHRRQVLAYVDKYLDTDRVSVCAGVIYPRAPRSPGLKLRVEDYLNEHGLQVVWYDD